MLRCCRHVVKRVLLIKFQTSTQWIDLYYYIQKIQQFSCGFVEILSHVHLRSQWSFCFVAAILAAIFSQLGQSPLKRHRCPLWWMTKRHLYRRLQEGLQSQTGPRLVTHVDVSTHSQRRPPPRQCQLLISNLGHDKQVNFHSHTAFAASTTNNTFARCCLAVRPAAEITCSQWTVCFFPSFFFLHEAPAWGTSATGCKSFISLANGLTPRGISFVCTFTVTNIFFCALASWGNANSIFLVLLCGVPLRRGFHRLAGLDVIGVFSGFRPGSDKQINRLRHRHVRDPHGANMPSAAGEVCFL